LPRLHDASGTRARNFLHLGLVDDFVNEMPVSLQEHGKKIFRLLGGTKVN